MKYKLRKEIKKRIPLEIFKNGSQIFFVSNYEIAKKDGLRAGRYQKFYKIDLEKNSNIGCVIWDLLDKFIQHPDLSEEEASQLVKMKLEDYQKEIEKKRFSFLDIKNLDEQFQTYSECIIKYDINEKKYSFGLIYIYKKGRTYLPYAAESTGKKGLCTFDTPLEFDANTSPEELGRMLMEAFDRSDKLTDYATGNVYPTKVVELLDDIEMSVEQPRDKHFYDFEDNGTAEIFQLYSYLPSEDAESSANIFIGIAAELNCDMSIENIAKSWEEIHGKPDTFETHDIQEGIFSLKAEMKNKKVHKVSYLVQRDESLLLECSMEVYLPNRRKKLDEKITALFKIFMEKCKLLS